MIPRVGQVIAEHRFTAGVWVGIAALLLISFGGAGLVAITGCDFFSPSPYTLKSAPASGAVRFEPNVGQADPRYRFIAHGSAQSIYLSSNEMVFHLRGAHWIGAEPRVVRAVLDGAQVDLAPDAQEPLSGRVNYLIGNDPKKWHTDIPMFRRVAFHGVYPGIDIAYHGTGGFLENDFIVQPGSDPASIRIRVTGADSIRVEPDGSLAIEAGRRTLRWKQPYLYQRGDQGTLQHIEGRFRTSTDGVVGFEVGAYDAHRALVIDPVLTYATYLGGASAEGAARVATDSSGNAYMIGGTDDVNFPSTPGAYVNVTSGVQGHVLVTKLTPDGKSLIYETHIGGSAGNAGFGIAVDSSGNSYLTGITASADYPVTHDLTTKNLTDVANCFVTELNAAGNKLVFSTLLGGSKADGCGGVAVDSSGNVYVAGATSSSDLPVVNAVQGTFPGGVGTPVSAFVAKLSPDGSKALYSTYFGGIGTNAATSIAVDSAGNAYFTGFTTSNSFPVTQGVYQASFGGSGGQNSMIPSLFAMAGGVYSFEITDVFGDAFVAKLSPTGQKVYATFLGGEKDDIGFSIAVDSKGNAYVAGATLSSKFPVQNAFQTSYHGAGGNTQASGGDGFIAELDPAGAQLVFSSYIGGSSDDRVLGMTLDSSGNIYLAGQTLSKDFPTAGQGAQTTYGGDKDTLFATGDAFLAEVDTTHKLAFSTYIGGSGGDWAAGVAVDGTGGIIVAGGTNSTDFQVTSGVVQSRYAGNDPQLQGVAIGDAFLARFGGSTSPVSIAGISNAASFAGGSIAPGEAILIAGTSIGPATLTGAQLDASGKISTQVAGTQFLFNNVAAPIVFVSAQYSSVIVPYEVASSASAQVVAIYNGSQSAAFTVPVAATVPGVFSANVSGTGQGAIFNSDLTHNSAQNAAARGSTVILFVTGEGQTSPAGIDGAVTASLIKPALPVTVSFGGTVATDYPFIGETPAVVAGVLQINVTIPQSAPTGASVPILVNVGNTPSQAGLTIAIQ